MVQKKKDGRVDVMRRRILFQELKPYLICQFLLQGHAADKKTGSYNDFKC